MSDGYCFIFQVLVTRVFIQNLKFNLTTSDYASALVHSNAVLLIKALDLQVGLLGARE